MKRFLACLAVWLLPLHAALAEAWSSSPTLLYRGWTKRRSNASIPDE